MKQFLRFCNLIQIWNLKNRQYYLRLIDFFVFYTKLTVFLTYMYVLGKIFLLRCRLKYACHEILQHFKKFSFTKDKLDHHHGRLVFHFVRD